MSKRILIIDDEVSIQTTLADIRLFLSPAGNSIPQSTIGKSLSPFLEADYKTAKKLFEKKICS